MTQHWYTGPKHYSPDVVTIVVSTSLTGSGQFVQQSLDQAEWLLARTSEIDGLLCYRLIGRPGAETELADWLTAEGATVDVVEDRTGTMRDFREALWTADALIVIWDGQDNAGQLAIHEAESRQLPYVAMCLDPLTGSVTPLHRKAPWVAYDPPEDADAVIVPTQGRMEPVAGCDERDPHDLVPTEHRRERLARATFYQPVGQDVVAQVETLVKPASWAEQDDDKEWFGRGTVQKEPELDWRSDPFDSELQDVGSPDYAAVITE